MANNNIRSDDVVVVLSGDSKGTKGKVIACSPKEGKVIVEGANMIHKHVKPRRQGEAGDVSKSSAVLSLRSRLCPLLSFSLSVWVHASALQHLESLSCPVCSS